MHSKFGINPRKIGVILGLIALCLAGISLVSEFFLEVIFADSEHPFLNLLDLFSVNVEQSIPTWFSTVNLFVASIVLALIAHAKWHAQDTYRWHWVGLAVVFLYLSIDEGASIHEYLTDPLYLGLNTRDYLYFAWVIVAVPLVIAFGLLYARFLFHLPPRTRYGVILSAIFYTGGALFIESLSANRLYDANNNIDFIYLLIATFEETLEMLGVITFITVLLAYMVANKAQFIMVWSPDDATENATNEGTDITLDNTVPSAKLTKSLSQLQQIALSDHIAPFLIVFLAGINLILIQWVLVRELTTILRGTELVILLVTVSYFIGISVGYRISGQIKRSWLLPIGSLVLFLHLTLPIWFRLLVIALDKLEVFGIAFLILPLLVPFVVSAFYSIFLPLFVDDGKGQITTLYTVEIMGAVMGILCLVFLSGVGIVTMLVIYATVLIGILALLGLSNLWTLRITLIAVGWLWFFPALNLWSNTIWFQQVQDLPNHSRTLLTAYSPYQKVDVLEDPQGNRYLFLDSMEHFSSQFGYWLNVVMGRIPASLIEPDNAVAFGGGSMELERMMANYSDHVTTVEIDSIVVNASLQYFNDYNQMDRLANRTVVIDDAKHFIANTDQEFDLIVSALPAAFTIQNGALYSVEFLEQVKSRLTEEGVFVANLTSIFAPDTLITRRITASVLATFDDVMVVTSAEAGLSFVYAGNDLPFSADDIRTALETNGETNYAIFEHNTVQIIVGDAEPMTYDSLDVILQISRDRIASRIQGE